MTRLLTRNSFGILGFFSFGLLSPLPLPASGYHDIPNALCFPTLTSIIIFDLRGFPLKVSLSASLSLSLSVCLSLFSLSVWSYAHTNASFLFSFLVFWGNCTNPYLGNFHAPVGSLGQSPQILKGLELTCGLGNHSVLLMDKASKDWRSWVCFCNEAIS